jgi:hypothetical protein
MAEHNELSGLRSQAAGGQRRASKAFHERIRPLRYWLEGHLYRLTNNPARLAALKDSLSGRPMLIVGNGPSLNSTPLADFNGIAAIGMNKIDLIFARTSWRPTMVLCMNRHVLSQHQQRFSETGIPLYVSWQSRWFSRRRRELDAAYFLNRVDNEFSRDIARGVGISGTVTYAALQFAYYMAADPVILFGVDHSFSTKGPANKLIVSEREDADHFDPAYFGKGVKWNLPDLEESEVGYRKAADAFQSAGRRIYDATVGGKLQVFPKIDAAMALSLCGRSGTAGQ